MGNEEGRGILQEERVFGKEGEYRLEPEAETKVVRRRKRVGLRREAQVMMDATAGFRMRGKRQRFAPDRYGFEYA